MNRYSYYFAFYFLFFSLFSVRSQGCICTIQWPTAAVTPTTVWATIATDNWAGDYAVVNVVAGNVYEFSTCAANGSNVTYDSQLTLTNNANAVLVYSDDYCGSQSYISWTATFTGTVRIHLAEWPCLTNTTNSWIRVRSSAAPPAPPNNTCASATTLTPSSTCNLVSGTTVGATEDPYIDPSCDPGIINDVWYTFNSGSYTSLNLTVNLGTASWIGVEFFNACGVLATGLSLGGTPSNCDFNTSAPNPTVITGLTPNTTYRMRLFTNVSYDIPGSFTTCLTTPPPPTVSVNSSSICSGQSATLTATPSTTGGSYLWSNGATTQSITVNPNSTTSYSVTYTNNGTANGSGTITVNALPTINAGQDVTVCQGVSTNLNATGGSTYVWTGGPSTSNYTVSPSSTTTYTVSGTDANGCSNTDQVVVNVNPLPVVNSVSDQTLCAGATATAVTFSGTAGATYNWTNNTPSIGLAASGSGNVPSFVSVNSTSSPITATITVIPTLSGCNGAAQTFTYTINPIPSLTAPSNQTVCAGSITNAVNFAGTAGATFNWTNSNTNIGLAASGFGNINSFTSTNTFSTPITSTVTVTPILGNCTGSSQLFTFTINPIPTITGNTVLCPNTTSQLSGSGIAASSNAWVSSNTSIATVSGTGLVNALSFGTTTITYTSNLSCSSSTIINVTNPTTPTFNSVNAICSGGTIQLPTSSTNGIQGTWSPAVNNTQTTSYTFTPNTGQCATTAQMTVTVNPNPSITGGNSLCAGNNLQLTGSGTPSTGSPWSSSNLTVGSISATGLVTGNAGGNTNIIYTDIQGCSATWNVTVNSNPIANAGQDITVCAGGNATLTGSALGGSAPYTYSWNNGVQNGNPFQVNSANSYTLTVTDALNCIGSDAMVINTSTIDWANLQWPSSGDMCLGQTHSVYGQLYIAGITNGAGPTAGVIAQIGVYSSNTDPSTWPLSAWNNTAFNTQVGNNDEYMATIGQLLPAGTYYYTFRYSLGQGCPYFYGGYNGGAWNGTSNTNGSLVINNAPTATSNISACGSYTWHGQTYSQSGTYVQTAPSSLSCDSVLYLNLTILGPINGETVDVSACNSYSWQGQTYSQSGIYSDTIQTSSGCDSIIHLNLTINNSLTGPTTEISACDSYTWNEQTYTQSGTYTYNGTAESGCDSLATLVLTINHGPINTTLVDNAGTLTTTSQNASTYSWLDCTTNMLIPGETGTTYLPTYTGMFASIATNNCGSDTSQCIEMEVQGLNDLNTQTLIIFPNPTKDLITINAQKSKIQTVELVDLNGKLVLKKAINTHVFQLDLTFFSEGIYVLKICDSENRSTLHRVVRTNF
ncbi:MAG: Ig-like domain-containing protein [Bacteroidota bacterium]